MKTYAISDIHGCYKTLLTLLDKIALTKEDKVYFLGDYIDRGIQSKEIVDFLIDLKKQGYDIVTLKGNHEDMLDDSVFLDDWFAGAEETLKSFQINHLKELNTEYLHWFYSLKPYAIIDKFIFVHAGLDFSNPDPLHNKRAMRWIKNWYKTIDYKWLGNRIIIHGHQPTSKTEIQSNLKNIHKRQVIGIDNDCVSKGKVGFGNLCCLEVNSMKLTFQENQD